MHSRGRESHDERAVVSMCFLILEAARGSAPGRLETWLDQRADRWSSSGAEAMLGRLRTFARAAEDVRAVATDLRDDFATISLTSTAPGSSIGDDPRNLSPVVPNTLALHLVWEDHAWHLATVT